MSREYDAVIDTPVGAIGIRVAGNAVAEVALGLVDHALRVPSDPMAVTVTRQILSYFADPRRPFSVPLRLGGTDFQTRVWRTLMQIPPGETATYGGLARQLGTSARAVGNACRANPCPLLVPCHRVIAVRGGLGGFAGHRDGRWMEIKRHLLEHEGGWLA